MAVQIQIRRGTTAEWASSNPILADGEMGYEKDTGKIKIGDGILTWSALPYQSGGSTDYVSGVMLIGTDLTFTGVGAAFAGVIDLSSLGVDVTANYNWEGNHDFSIGTVRFNNQVSFDSSTEFNGNVNFSSTADFGGNKITNIADGTVAADGVNLEQVQSLIASSSTGLEAIDEGNGPGFRTVGKDPNDFGNIGFGAVDFGSSSAVTDGGALGTQSFNLGVDNKAEGFYAQTIGYLNNVNGDYSTAYGASINVTGENSIAVGSGITITDSLVVAMGALHNVSGYAGTAFGYDNSVTDNYASSFGVLNQSLQKWGGTFGAGLYANDDGVVVVGTNNTEYAQNGGLNNPLARKFIVGIGDMAGGSPVGFGTKRDGLIVYHGGEIVAPELTIAKIDAESTNKILTTKEWVLANVGGAVDSVNTYTGAVVLDADDIDDSSTTNKFVTASQLIVIGNTSGVNTGDQDISGIVTNTSAISTLQGEQTTQDAAIALNTAKVGVTTEEANPDVVSQVEAEAGTATTERTWTAERVRQAIDALAPTVDGTLAKSSTIVTSRNAVLSDVDGINESTSATDVTITIQDSGTLTIPIDNLLTYRQEGDGSIILEYNGTELGRTYIKGDVVTGWQDGSLDNWKVMSSPRKLFSSLKGEPAGAQLVGNVVSISESAYAQAIIDNTLVNDTFYVRVADAVEALLTGTAFDVLGATSGSGNPENAFDANTGNFYASEDGDSEKYIGLDLGAGNEKRITRVRVYARGGFNSRAHNLNIEVGNTSETAGFTVVGNTGTDNVSAQWYEYDFTDTPIAYRYIRLSVVDTTQSLNVAELEFYGY